MTIRTGRMMTRQMRRRPASRRFKALHHARRSRGRMVEALKQEVADVRDKMLRTLAEMENLRKRTSRKSRTREPTASRLCPRRARHRDNLQRALDAVPAKPRPPPIPV